MLSKLSKKHSISQLKIAIRGSPLSQQQYKEISSQLNIECTPLLINTYGDLDRKTSLKQLGKTDFFTREVDQAVLNGQANLSIHSAKDLPEVIPDDLDIIAVTQSISDKDCLLLKEGLTPRMLTEKHLIATSSHQREERVKQLNPYVSFKDLRGTIHERIEQMTKGFCDGIVVAQAALMRLDICYPNSYILNGPSTPHQGQLAILAKREVKDLLALFAHLDVREKVLYTGLQCKNHSLLQRFIHYPLISLKPYTMTKQDLKNLEKSTHILFTSPSAVHIFFKQTSLRRKITPIAIGPSTEKAVQKYIKEPILTAKTPCQEGLIQFLESQTTNEWKIFWPHSKEARPLLASYFQEKHISYTSCILYEPLPIRQSTPPPLDEVNALYFTSPSQITSFKQQFGPLPKNKKYLTIGPITEKALNC